MIGWRVQLVGLETLIRELDFKGLVIFLVEEARSAIRRCTIYAEPTSGTCSFSACEEAASVVTSRADLFARGVTMARCLNGKARGARSTLLIIFGGKMYGCSAIQSPSSENVES